MSAEVALIHKASSERASVSASELEASAHRAANGKKLDGDFGKMFGMKIPFGLVRRRTLLRAAVATMKP